MDTYIVIYLILVNLIGFAMMFSDKQRAKRRGWRVPEKLFFIVSVIGGAAGTWLGMYVFRHKTKHWYFVLGVPFILIVQIILVVKFMI